MRPVSSLPRDVRPEDTNYYASRALQEQAAAANARCEAARQRHEELALRYLLRAGMLTVRRGAATRSEGPVKLVIA
jgi:hypothetical protein